MARANQKRKETWYRSFRSIVRKTLEPAGARFEKQLVPIPAWAMQPWYLELCNRLGAAINQSLNLKDDDEASPAVLGILCAQAENCSAMRITPVFKETNASATTRRHSRRMWKLITPLQEAFGKVAGKIMRVMERQPYDVQIAFHNAYCRASERKMFQKGNLVFWETPASRLYLTPHVAGSLDARGQKCAASSRASFSQTRSHRRKRPETSRESLPKNRPQISGSWPAARLCDVACRRFRGLGAGCRAFATCRESQPHKCQCRGENRRQVAKAPHSGWRSDMNIAPTSACNLSTFSNSGIVTPKNSRSLSKNARHGFYRGPK